MGLSMNRTVRPQTLPIFVIPGMSRAGTTFLYHNLQKHPAIFLPYRKETNYFGGNYHRGVGWYHDLYRGLGPTPLGGFINPYYFGDISPYYFVQEEAIQRISAYSPAVKVILAVREPAEWAISVYNQVSSYDWRVPPFERFIQGYRFRIAKSRVALRLSGGLVSRMIHNYRSAFGDNLLIYDFALFRRDPLFVLRVIEQFLGLEPYFEDGNFDDVVINAANRRHFKLLTSVLTNETLVSALGSAFSRRVIQRFRSWFDILGSCQPGDKERLPCTPEIRDTARQAFAADSDTVSALFAESEMQLGSGDPFNVDCSGASEDRANAMTHPNERQDAVTSKC